MSYWLEIKQVVQKYIIYIYIYIKTMHRRNLDHISIYVCRTCARAM